MLAFGDRVPALTAAFANGAMAHCLDFDDQTPWGQHSASSIVPAVFAVAERLGGVSGREMIAAVAVGQDVFARLRRNVGWRKDWNLSTVLGVFAGAAATARLLGLTPQATAHALGVASMQSSGVMEVVAGTGSNLRALYAGFSAKGAVLAALLADKGVTGVDRLFEGEYGVFADILRGQLRPRRDTARSRPGVPGRYNPLQALAVRGDVTQPHPCHDRHRHRTRPLSRGHRRDPRPCRRLPRPDVPAAGGSASPDDTGGRQVQSAVPGGRRGRPAQRTGR